MGNDLQRKYADMLAKKGASQDVVDQMRAYQPTLSGSYDKAKKNPAFWAVAAPLAGATLGAGLGALGIGGAGAAGGGTAAASGAAKAAGAGGGAMDWLKGKLGGVTGGDWLNALGTGVGGYLDYKGAGQDREQSIAQFAEAMKQRQAEAATAAGQFDRNLANTQGQFDRTQDATEGQLAVRAETAINKAPLADKSQALLMARMGASPTAFQPRDFTSSLSNINRPASGGPADSIAASRTAAAGYQPGQGGVKTDALKLIRDRMLSSIQPPTATVSAPTARPPQRALTAPRQTLMLPATTDQTQPSQTVPVESDTESSTDLLRRRMAPRFGAPSRPAYT